MAGFSGLIAGLTGRTAWPADINLSNGSFGKSSEWRDLEQDRFTHVNKAFRCSTKANWRYLLNEPSFMSRKIVHKLGYILYVRTVCSLLKIPINL